MWLNTRKDIPHNLFADISSDTNEKVGIICGEGLDLKNEALASLHFRLSFFLY